MAALPPAAQALLDEARNPATPTPRLEALVEAARSSGTLLYGLLGKGTTEGVLGDTAWGIYEGVAANPNAPVLLLLALAARSEHLAYLAFSNPILPLQLLVEPINRDHTLDVFSALRSLAQAVQKEPGWPEAIATWLKRHATPKTRRLFAGEKLQEMIDRGAYGYVIERLGKQYKTGFSGMMGMGRVLVELEPLRRAAVPPEAYRPVPGLDVVEVLAKAT